MWKIEIFWTNYGKTWKQKHVFYEKEKTFNRYWNERKSGDVDRNPEYCHIVAYKDGAEIARYDRRHEFSKITA